MLDKVEYLGISKDGIDVVVRSHSVDVQTMLSSFS